MPAYCHIYQYRQVANCEWWGRYGRHWAQALGLQDVIALPAQRLKFNG